MLPDRVSNPGPLTYESGALPIALRGPATDRWTDRHTDTCTNGRKTRSLYCIMPEAGTTTNLVISGPKCCFLVHKSIYLG